MTQASTKIFLGIGGIGMSAIARYYLNKGVSVCGYDRYQSPLCKQLEEEGAEIIYEQDVSWLQSKVGRETEIIYTPALSEHSEILTWARSTALPVRKRSEELGRLSGKGTCLAVGGTHGKTTTTSMLAVLLAEAKRNVTAFLGGISANFKSNFYQSNTSQGEWLTVVEADEYDRSFLRLKPHHGIITSTDSDHLDIYGGRNEVLTAFKEFANLVDGKVFTASEELVGLQYSALKDTSIRANDVEWREEGTRFTYSNDELDWKDLFLPLPGVHNLENAIGAISVAKEVGLSEEEVRNGLAAFKGIKRRFERVYSDDTLTVYDDYAHHPTEIEAVINSVKRMYPGKAIYAVFQPHLYSRTRDFAGEFAKALDLADYTVLNPIYPAREEPIPGVSSKSIGRFMKGKVDYKERDDWMNWLKDIKEGVLLILGAGDIDHVVEPIVNHLNIRNS
jgi:UDP-N-acetylmuramate--alanine ligase